MKAKEGRAFQTYEPPSRRAARGSLLALIGFVGLSLLVWAANRAITAGSTPAWYWSLTAPPGTPPAWRVAPGGAAVYPVKGTWGWQLLANSLWSPAFFGLHNPGLSLFVIALLLAAILLTLRRFVPLQPVAAALMLPYALWVGYAAYLNVGFWWLNRA